MILLILFEKWATLKFMHDANDDDLVIKIALMFLQNRQGKNEKFNIYDSRDRQRTENSQCNYNQDCLDW